jgi:hypothetical protein
MYLLEIECFASRATSDRDSGCRGELYCLWLYIITVYKVATDAPHGCRRSSREC